MERGRQVGIMRAGRVALVGLCLALAACGGGPTEDMLRGGVPARTDLHRASTLPPQSVRTVNRNDAGWRVIYRPGAAPANAEQGAAKALCGLEHKRAVEIRQLPLDGPGDDPGARKIDIICG
ncbi:hypothetical protein DRW48_15165 [Paracoccus suum]|uniref:Uncharacterized protein n=1 Tax=Paracoccus suum TaxID=2259340 RepID=A0A344PN83_9RHOB|nr:hypothetical protein [Paracoccus suum]AXC50838.1 hypothetical protein DRW48_15165 [Paracoccus suum]